MGNFMCDEDIKDIDMERKIYERKIYDKILNKTICDLEIIQEIDSKFNINYVIDRNNCWSLLMNAVLQNRIELVRHFMTYPNININYKDRRNHTALYFAYGRSSILKLLLKREDLDVNMRYEHGNTILHRYSNVKGYVKVLLLDVRIDISIRNNMGKTARDIAIHWEYYGIADMLRRVQYTSLLRIPNKALLYDIVRTIICEYV